jgi:hypothetical protein
MRSLLGPAAWLPLLVLAFLSGPLRAQQGTIVYVAREQVSDEGLRKQLESVGGSQARRLVLVLGKPSERDGKARFLEPRSREAANDVALGRAIEEAEVLVLRGGSFLDWYETVYPNTGRTQLARSLRRFLQTERPIVAYGGACAFLSGGVSVPTDELDGVERNPRRREQPFTERVAVGVGPRALFDSAGWKGGEPIRLLEALHRTRLDLGFFPVGDVALSYQRTGRTLEVLGPGSVLAFDLSKAKRSRGRVDRARLYQLTRSDRWEFGFGRAVPGPDKVASERTYPPPSDEGITTKLPCPEAMHLRGWLRALSAGSLNEIEGQHGRGSWSLRWDSGSSLFEAEGLKSILGVETSASWTPH